LSLRYHVFISFAGDTIECLDRSWVWKFSPAIMGLARFDNIGAKSPWRELKRRGIRLRGTAIRFHVSDVTLVRISHAPLKIDIHYFSAAGHWQACHTSRICTQRPYLSGDLQCLGMQSTRGLLRAAARKDREESGSEGHRYSYCALPLYPQPVSMRK
jgi:hypothetical protein